MKIGANSVLFGAFDLETAFKYTALAGYDGIELSAIERMSEHLVVAHRLLQASSQPTDAFIEAQREAIGRRSRAELLGEVRAQNEALARHRDQLEATVAERTAKLQAMTRQAGSAARKACWISTSRRFGSPGPPLPPSGAGGWDPSPATS